MVIQSCSFMILNNSDILVRHAAPAMVFIGLVYFDANNIWVVLNSPASQYDR